jgi:hypothetical protein
MIIASRDHRADSRKMRRMRDGGEHLRSADVGAPRHADFAVRVRQRSSPFHSVVAIFRIVAKRIPLAFRCIAPANVLYDEDVAVAGYLIRRRSRPTDAFVVRRTHQDDRELSVCPWTVNIGMKSHAVTRFHGDAILRDHRIALLGTNAVRYPQDCRTGHQNRVQDFPL